MADFEVLAPGGHQHLVGKIKEQLAMKADTAMADAVDKVARNQATREVEGELVSVEDAYGAPMLSLDVDGKSTQVTTTGKNLFDPAPLEAISGVVKRDDNSYRFTTPLSQFNNKRIWTNPGISGPHVISYEKAVWNSSGSTGISIFIRFNDGSSDVLIGNTDANPYWALKYAYVSDMSKVSFLYISYNQSRETLLRNIQIEVGSSPTAYEPYTGGASAPSPAYPQAIGSVDELIMNLQGKNYVDPAYIEQGSFTNGVVIDMTTRCRSSKFIRMSGGETVTPSGNVSGGSVEFNIVCYRSTDSLDWIATSGWKASGTPYTLPDGTKYVRIAFRRSDNTDVTPENFSNIQLELGSTATTYEPYASTTVSIDLTEHPLRSLPDGTRDELNLTYLRPSTTAGWAVYGRELVRAIGHVADMGELDWSVQSAANGVYYALLPETSDEGACLCSCYQWQTSVSSGNLLDGHACRQHSYNRVLVKDTAHASMTKADYTALVTGQAFDYLLATPVTTTLDPIELPVLPAPTCTVWADPTTGLQMEYVRDTQLVIDSLNAEIDRAHAAIAPVEHGTSSANYAVGSYLMLDGTFCKVTSAIATGETIAIGTNVVATTVDAELASLA